MAFLLKKNCATTSINQVGGIDSSATSIIVADASSFPTTGDFLVTIWNKETFPNPCDDPNVEIVKVTDVVGNTFTIVRGQEDTVGVAHSNSQSMEMLITAGTFEDIEDEISSSLNIPVRGEDLTSQIDGITDTFTIANSYISNTTTLKINGQDIRRSFGYTEDTVTTIKVLGDILVVGEKLVISYIF